MIVGNLLIATQAFLVGSRNRRFSSSMLSLGGADNQTQYSAECTLSRGAHATPAFRQ